MANIKSQKKRIKTNNKAHERNKAVKSELRTRVRAFRAAAEAGDGLSLWVRMPVPARAVCEQLMRRGWLARPGNEFALAGADANYHLRLTVHDLDSDAAERLAADLVATVEALVAPARVG